MEPHAASAGGPRFAASRKGQNVHGNSQQHYRPGESETLRFLSREERECIMFLEETIDSLDHELQDPVAKRSSGLIPTGGQRSLNPKEQDIIDLVQNQPHPGKEVPYHPSVPDFQTMAVDPETHFEMRPRRGTAETFPNDFNPPTSLNPSVPPENMGSTSHPLYHPAGLVPTPVVIAQRMAEFRKPGDTAVSSAVLHDRGRSLNQDRAPPSPDYPGKQGPPTAAKPAHYPANISFLKAKKGVNHNITAPSVQELKAQVLTNLTGKHELEEPQVRNIPSRSSSYRDPDPEKSRMEALSKLGLIADIPSSRSTAINPPVVTTNQTVISVNNVSSIESNPEPFPSSLVSSIKTDTSTPGLNSYGGKSRVLAPSPSGKHDTDIQHPSNFESRPYAASPSLDSAFVKTEVSTNSYGGKSRNVALSPSVKHNADVQHLKNFEDGPTTVSPSSGSGLTNTEVSTNSYGGKSKVMTSASPLKREVTTFSDEHDGIPGTASSPSDATEASSNSYGGKSKVMIPASSSKREITTYSDEHNGIHSRVTNPPDPTQALNNSFGGKSKSIVLLPAPAAPTDANLQASKPDREVPAMIPQSQPTVSNTSSIRLNPRSQDTPVSTKHNMAPLSTVQQKQSVSSPKPSLHSQGISVQFSGRGATDQSRVQALRELGLLK